MSRRTTESTNEQYISAAAGGENAAGSESSSGLGRSYFEAQRAKLVTEISLSLEHVLMNLNLLNRSLEGVITVGKEFESVETLWSQFEGVMGSGAGGGVGGGTGSGTGASGVGAGAGGKDKEREREE